MFLSTILVFFVFLNNAELYPVGKEDAVQLTNYETKINSDGYEYKYGNFFICV